jgi:hypothetical protein
LWDEGSRKDVHARVWTDSYFWYFFLTPHGPLHLHICSLFGWLVASGWCWFVLREKYCWLVAGAWFVLREKYCWLVVDKPNEQGVAPFRPPSASA